MQRYNNNVQGPNGQAIVGAVVVVTVAANPPGTGAPATVFSDDGITQIPNTILTDALGRFAFYVPSGKYDLAFSGGSPLIALPYVLANVEITDHLEFQILDATPVAGEVFNFTELASGPTPGAGTVNLYTKIADKLMYYKNDAGIEVGPLGSGSGGGSPAGSTGAIQTNNAGVFGAGPQVATVAIKPQASDNIQYVSPNGNDLNDGFSVGTAKLTVYAALQALPGGSATTAGNGTVLISGSVNYGGPVVGQGFWLMGGTDPNFAAPPPGWLKHSALAPATITIDCLSANLAAANGHTGHCGFNAGSNSVPYPAVWISGIAGSITLNNLAFSNYIGNYVRYGIDSNNNRNGSGGSSGFAMRNVTMNNGNCGSNANQKGPAIDIGSNSFWIWMKEIVGTGCSKEIFTVGASGAARLSGLTTITTTVPNDIVTGDLVTLTNILDDSFNGSFTVTVVDSTHFTYPNPGPDITSGTGQVVTFRAAAINIDPGTGGGSGLIFMDDLNLNGGNIRYKSGFSGGGFYARNISYEGAGSGSPIPDLPIVLITGTQATSNADGTNIRVENLEISDPSFAVPGVQVDNASAFSDLVMVSRIAGPVRGKMTVLGGTGIGTIPASNATYLRQQQFGIRQGQIIATGIDVARRGFSPVAVPGVNIALTNPASWTFQSGTGTITPNIPAPDGTNGAGRVAGTLNPIQFVSFYSSTTALNLGDTYVFGVWVRSATANGYSQNVPPIKFVFSNLGFGTGDTCVGPAGSPPGNGVIIGNVPGPKQADGQWQWYSGVCKVASNPTLPGTLFAGSTDSTRQIDYYSPILVLFPAGTISDNEAYELAANLAPWAPNALKGEVSMLPSQRFRPGSTTFSNLGTPPAGVTFIGCSDCSVTNPCTGFGTGALAKSINGVWSCSDTPAAASSIFSTYVNASTRPGTDMCAKIANAWSSLAGATGGTVDATGFHGSQTCAASPWTNYPANFTGTLLFSGDMQLITNVSIVQPAGSIVDGNAGHPTGQPNSNAGTVVYVSGSFPTNTPLWAMGSVTNSPGIQIRNMKFNCSTTAGVPIAGCIGLQNQWAQENSLVKNVWIDGCQDTGLDISTSQAQNGGNYENVNVAMNNVTNAGATCVRIGSAATSALILSRMLDGITCNADSHSTQANVGIAIDASAVVLENFHVEGSITGIQVGANRGVHGAMLLNGTCSGVFGKPMTSCIDISSANTPDNISVMNVSTTNLGNITNVLVDHNTNGGTVAQINESTIASYVRGSNATNAVWTTSNQIAGVVNQFSIVATTFAALGTPPNGSIVYCSDCTIASPCAGGGTGALAKRLNATWVCN